VREIKAFVEESEAEGTRLSEWDPPISDVEAEDAAAPRSRGAAP
jgi:hypothetical protein